MSSDSLNGLSFVEVVRYHYYKSQFKLYVIEILKKKIKISVSKKSFDFLTQVHTLPNLDLSKLNISLYNHAPELAKVRDYRYTVSTIYLALSNSLEWFKILKFEKQQRSVSLSGEII